MLPTLVLPPESPPSHKTYSVQRYSIAEFLALELADGFLYELINGSIMRKTSPTTQHQRVLSRLNTIINNFVLANKLGEVFFAPVDVFLGENSLVNPDLLFVRISRSHLITKDGIMGSPDLVVEVLSPSTMKYDRGSKKDLYEQHQIPEYWIIDLNNQAIEVYTLQNEDYVLEDVATEKGTIQSKVLVGLVVEVGEIFG